MGMYECNDQMVSHPQHYQGKGGMEVIDVIEAFTADLFGIEATDTGNIIKYACRWKHKNGIQDLKKIMWYTQHLIDHLENAETENKNVEEACALLTSWANMHRLYISIGGCGKNYTFYNKTGDETTISGVPEFISESEFYEIVEEVSKYFDLTLNNIEKEKINHE